MNVGEIVRAYLLEHGYDGLYDPQSDCACRLDGLDPCDEMSAVFCCAGRLKNGVIAETTTGI